MLLNYLSTFWGAVQTDPQRLFIKRAKIDFNIIKKESDPKTKFELFQRLNTLGSRLTDQEVRNCLLVMTNRTFYKWLKELADYPAFQNCISLSDNLIKQQYDLELVLRFIAYKNSSIEDIRGLKDVGDFLTKKMTAFATNENFEYVKEEGIFKNTFSLLENALGEESFKKYDINKDKFVGPFLISPFEVIAVGLASNIEKWTVAEIDVVNNIKNKAKSIWGNERFTLNSGSGTNATQRLPVLLPLGKELFSNVNNIR